MIDDLIERIIDEKDLTSDQKLAMLRIIVSRRKEARKEHNESPSHDTPVPLPTKAPAQKPKPEADIVVPGLGVVSTTGLMEKGSISTEEMINIIMSDNPGMSYENARKVSEFIRPSEPAPKTNAPTDDFFSALENVNGKAGTPPSIDHAVVDSPVIVKYGIPGPFLNGSGDKEENEEKPGFVPHK